MGIYSTSQFFGAFVGGILGGWSLQQFGVDGLFLLLAVILASGGWCPWDYSRREHCKQWF